MRKVSVIIPSYNHASYVIDAARSVTTQTHPEVELVVVDDGSSDDSVARLESFASACARPIRIIRQANAGAHAAIERGIAESYGDCIAILNSDDLFRPERLSLVLQAAEHQDEFVAFTEVDYIDSYGAPFSPDNPHKIWYISLLHEADREPGIGFGLLLGNYSISTSNYIFSRKLHERVGPFRPYLMAHDVDFLLRCTRRVEPIFIRRPLLNYRLHDSNTTKKAPSLITEEMVSIISAYLDEVSLTAPDNSKAPGSRALRLYFAHFVEHRPTLFAGETIAKLTGRLVCQQGDLDKASLDARTLFYESERMSGVVAELRSEQRSLHRLFDEQLDYIRSLKEGRDWHAAQHEAWNGTAERLLAEREELQRYIETLKEGRDSHAAQHEAWKNTAERLLAERGELQRYIEMLKEGRDSHAAQHEAWKDTAERLLAEREELQRYIETLKEGRDWHAAQHEAWKGTAERLGKRRSN